MGGLAVLFATTSHQFEFTTGFDYVFPVNIQGQQSTNGLYSDHQPNAQHYGL